MICSLDSLKKSLKKECSVTILEATEPELQMFLNRWGICSRTASVKKGPWGSFILKCNGQEIALGPAIAHQLQVETI
jgi:hypothetical protein